MDYFFLAMAVYFACLQARVKGDSFGIVRKESSSKKVRWLATKGFESTVLSLCLLQIMYLLGKEFSYYDLALPFAFVLGVAPGWSMLGAVTRGDNEMDSPEGWQKKLGYIFPAVLTSPLLALCARGLLLALPLVILGSISGENKFSALGVCYGSALVISALATRDWEYAESTRPLFCTVFYWVILQGL